MNAPCAAHIPKLVEIILLWVVTATRTLTGTFCGNWLAELASLLVNFHGSRGCCKDTTRGHLRRTEREGAN